MWCCVVGCGMSDGEAGKGDKRRPEGRRGAFDRGHGLIKWQSNIVGETDKTTEGGARLSVALRGDIIIPRTRKSKI